MVRALFITYENEFPGELTTEVRLIDQPVEDLLRGAPDSFRFQPVLSYLVEKDDKKFLNVGFLSDFDLPDSIDVNWETIPADFLLRVTLHDVDVEIDPEHDTITPISIGNPVMTLFQRSTHTREE